MIVSAIWKECAGAAGNQNRGDSGFFVEITGTFKKWSDRFFFTLDNLLHKGVAYHEVCGRGILIKKKKMTAGFHAFYDTGGLRGTAAGIQGREAMGIFFIWKIVDKQRNINIFNKSPIFGTQLDGCVVCDARIRGHRRGHGCRRPVPGRSAELIFRGNRRPRLRVIPCAYAHSGGGSLDVEDSGKFAELSGEVNGMESFSGTGGNAAFPGKNGAVCHKCAELSRIQSSLTDKCLVLRQVPYRISRFTVRSGWNKKNALRTQTGRKSKRIFSSSVGIDGAAVGREVRQRNRAVDSVFADFAGCSGEDFLPAVADSEQAAFTGALCAETV